MKHLMLLLTLLLFPGLLKAEDFSFFSRNAGGAFVGYAANEAFTQTEIKLKLMPGDTIHVVPFLVTGVSIGLTNWIYSASHTAQTDTSDNSRFSEIALSSLVGALANWTIHF